MTTTTRTDVPFFLSGAVTAELKGRPEYGFMFTPYMGNDEEPETPWTADTGLYSKDPAVVERRWEHFQLEDYLGWLAARDRTRCLFATAPDKVGDAAVTLARSRPAFAPIRALGIPVAFVAQDGIEQTAIPWADFDVLFIGGTTEFKLGPVAAKVAAEAKRRGKWVHMGRVNSAKRYVYADSIGCDSTDGTILAFGPTVNLRRVLSWPAAARKARKARELRPAA